MIPLLLTVTLSIGDVETRAAYYAPAVVAARERVSEAHAQLAVARGTGAPHAVINYNQVPQAGDTATVLSKLTTYAGSVSLSDLAGRDAAVTGAQDSLESAEASLRDAVRSEQIKAIGLYIDLQRASVVRQLQESIVSAARDDRRAARLRYQAGDAPRLDWIRADVELASAQAELASAIAEENTARAALGIEIGETDFGITPFPDAPPPPVVYRTADEAVAVALRARPEIAAARAEIAAEDAAIEGAKAAGLPSLSVQVGYTTGVDTATNVNGPSADVTLDFPISGAAAGRVAAERARLAQAQARLDVAIQTVTLEVRSAFASLRAQESAARATSDARFEAQAELRATETGYRGGASSSLELADARRTYAQAAIADYSARAAFYQAVQSFALIVGAEK